MAVFTLPPHSTQDRPKQIPFNLRELERIQRQIDDQQKRLYRIQLVTSCSYLVCILCTILCFPLSLELGNHPDRTTPLIVVSGVNLCALLLNILNDREPTEQKRLFALQEEKETILEHIQCTFRMHSS